MKLIGALLVLGLAACGDPKWDCTCETSCGGKTGAAYSSEQCGGKYDTTGVTMKAKSDCASQLAASCTASTSYCVCTCAESSSFCG